MPIKKYTLNRLFFRLFSNLISKTFFISSSLRGKLFRKLGVDIKENVFIGQNVYFDELAFNRIHIDKNCIITRGGVFLTHFIDSKTRNFILGDVYIGENSFIGMNTIITKPVTIGKNCIIGAGSIVTKDIPDNCVAAGNPCKILKTLGAK